METNILSSGKSINMRIKLNIILNHANAKTSRHNHRRDHTGAR